MPLSPPPARPNLEHLRNQAKDLLKAYRAREPLALARFRKSSPQYSQHSDIDLARLCLSLRDAQSVVAVEYGFPHWQCLKKYVERKEIFSMIEMNVDHVRVQDATDNRIVILKANALDMYLPIWVGKWEGDAISQRLQGQDMPRPMTHSLMASMLRGLGAEINRIVISDIVDDTIFSTITLRNGESMIEIDSRPSDAIALAVHCAHLYWHLKKC
jgi:bifunctional DNase/RNase